MFESISTAPPDAILGLTEAFQKDPNPEKINLSVGVYKDASGQTPVLRCVKEAERRLVETEATKGYLSIDGQPEYRQHVKELVFGDRVDDERLAVVQCPGGTGALRLGADLIADQLKPAKVWLSDPTWANHHAIFTAAGVRTETYPYLNSSKTGLDFDAMLERLQQGPATGDVVLLHACCHNPTGVDPTLEQWQKIAEALASRGILPMIDFAYQGFGDGLVEDTMGLQTVGAACDEMIVANSFSKNFGLYSERVGALSVITNGPASATLSQLKRLVRTNYSNPPRHGGSIVATVLGDDSLRAIWLEELSEMRLRISTMRKEFVDRMHALQNKQNYTFLLDQRGMFSFSGLNPMQVDQLKNEHSIYIVGSGRINVAGMTPDNLPRLCEAICKVIEA